MGKDCVGEGAVFRVTVPCSQEFDQGERVDEATVVRIIFALRQTNLELLHQTVMKISNPENSQYGTSVIALFHLR